MPNRVYFDTDAFHRIGASFADKGLRPELRERILVAPLVMFEVFSQLSLKKNDEILSHIKAMHNWLNPDKAGMLPWPTDAIARIGFGKALGRDDFTSRMQKSINVCLATDSADTLRIEAGKLKDALDKMKDSSAAQFTQLVETNRKKPLKELEFLQFCVGGIAKRAGVDPACKPMRDVVSALSAYIEYEQERLNVATSNLQYKPDKNDILDAEQLPYLGDPSLHLITCDGGYLARIKKSPQAKRIHRVSVEDLDTGGKISGLIQTLTT